MPDNEVLGTTATQPATEAPVNKIDGVFREDADKRVLVLSLIQMVQS